MSEQRTFHLTAPLDETAVRSLRAGDRVLLSGTIYTARDAAHKRLCALLEQGKPLPFPPQGAVIYYVGPTPPRPGQAIGSAGPTTSYRMDAYAPALLAQGVRGMIGKGLRADAVIEAMQQCGAVYFGTIGGAGALLAQCVKQAQLVCYEDLGSEAVRRLEIEQMPLTVVIDAAGGNLYETGPKAYRVFAQEMTEKE